jgi:hypothetical protein
MWALTCPIHVASCAPGSHEKQVAHQGGTCQQSIRHCRAAQPAVAWLKASSLTSALSLLLPSHKACAQLPQTATARAQQVRPAAQRANLSLNIHSSAAACLHPPAGACGVHVRLTHLGLQEPGHHAYAPAHQPALPHLCWAKLTTIQGQWPHSRTTAAAADRGGGGPISTQQLLLAWLRLPCADRPSQPGSYVCPWLNSTVCTCSPAGQTRITQGSAAGRSKPMAHACTCQHIPNERATHNHPPLSIHVRQVVISPSLQLPAGQVAAAGTALHAHPRTWYGTCNQTRPLRTTSCTT